MAWEKSRRERIFNAAYAGYFQFAEADYPTMAAQVLADQEARSTTDPDQRAPRLVEIAKLQKYLLTAAVYEEIPARRHRRSADRYGASAMPPIGDQAGRSRAMTPICRGRPRGDCCRADRAARHPR